MTIRLMTLVKPCLSARHRERMISCPYKPFMTKCVVYSCICMVRAHRVTLVELLFASQNAPPLPETDPQLRRALLDSLKTFEEQEARRPAFVHEPRVSVPEPAATGVLQPFQEHCHCLTQCTRAPQDAAERLFGPPLQLCSGRTYYKMTSCLFVHP